METYIAHGGGKGLAVPLVYALLARKTTVQYTTVLHALYGAVDEYNLTQCDPERFMFDFEKAIFNACADMYPTVDMRCCFSHSSQSLFRRVQESCLQVQYHNQNDRRIKSYTHMLLASASVPIADVRATIHFLQGNMQEVNFKPVLDYFNNTYVNDTPG